MTIDEGAAVLRTIERDGGVDAFNIYGASPNSTGAGTPDMTYPPALNAPHSARVRAELERGTPVICGGRSTTRRSPRSCWRPGRPISSGWCAR